MQEIQTGGIMILQQLKKFKFKLPQLFNGLQQLIDEPTHICKNSSSCIDLIFTNQPNLIVNRGRHPSLHENYQHKITYAKTNPRVEYPPPYKCHVWNYAKANVNGINKAIS